MSGVGTDEHLISEVFGKIKTQVNFNKVYNSFGVRQYSSTFGNIGDPITSKKRDLVFWLNSELTEQEKKYLSSNFKNIKVEQCEISSSSELPEVVAHTHFFFFPTLHENFGHVIAESLALAKPIIISDHTPWNNLETNNVGFTIGLSQKERYVEILKKCYKMDRMEYAAMQEKCLPYLKEFKEKYSSKEMYYNLLNNEK